MFFSFAARCFAASQRTAPSHRRNTGAAIVSPFFGRVICEANRNGTSSPPDETAIFTGGARPWQLEKCPFWDSTAFHASPMPGASLSPRSPHSHYTAPRRARPPLVEGLAQTGDCSPYSAVGGDS